MYSYHTIPLRLLLHCLVLLLAGKLKHKLQITRNKMVRFILKLPSRAHISQAQLDAVRFLNVSDRVTQLRLNHVFKIKTGTSPMYLREHFSGLSNMHDFSTRSNENSNHFVPYVNSVSQTTFLLLSYSRLELSPSYDLTAQSLFIFQAKY